ncbi:pyridoxamine 5'-phosphate oxidase family protein [Reichenbachiella sp. MALMAid0571]|uniref:pyridoxamine 5'-phosphate oxidase family protein n=1 Tax=Reichenbachiella sp. MALMAid0571 TaxID=3143939 RepID=UPI0032DED126
MSQFEITKKNKVVRGAKRATYDEQKIYDILDAGFLCHVAFNINNQPFMIPTAYGRRGDLLYIHGSVKSRTIKNIAKGVPVCLAVTHLDGLVLARSAFHHSVNYRSVIIYGTAVEVTERSDKNDALYCITENILKGRWEETRKPNDKELDITGVLAIKIESASAKVRMGGPVDDQEDYDLDIWAGHLPLNTCFGKPVSDEKLKNGIEISPSVEKKLC